MKRRYINPKNKLKVIPLGIEQHLNKLSWNNLQPKPSYTTATYTQKETGHTKLKKYPDELKQLLEM